MKTPTEIDVDELVINAKKALAWFIEIMGIDEWTRRRKNVVDYLNAVSERQYNFEEDRAGKLSEMFMPIAVYNDMMAWYMYLIESYNDRPTCDDPTQSSRICPAFAAIGRRIEELKKVEGIEDRLKELTNEKELTPDPTLFEILVCGNYLRNGWEVKFLKEDRKGKMPDMLVSRAGEKYYVECKRLAKVNSHAEKERLAWQDRSKHLFNAMMLLEKPSFATITFKEPVESYPETILGQIFYRYNKMGFLETGALLPIAGIDFKATPIDLARVKESLDLNCVRPNSAQLIHLLTGEYDMHGSYAVVISPSEVMKAGKDDGLHALNDFICGVHTAFAAKWECTSEQSSELKAKDIKRLLVKAVSQIPENEKGIIHIGYETVCGPHVEEVRYAKIQDTVNNFGFGSKKIESVYCHAMQPLMTLDKIECAETTIYYENKPRYILQELLLLDAPGTAVGDSSHWHEDLYE